MVYKKYINICSFLLVIFSNTLFATDYYIDARGGNDSNSGLSPASAWKTLAKVNARSFLPGDKILFKRNEIWTGTALTIKNNGNATDRIVFGAYGVGERPIISLKSALPDWNNSTKWVSTGNSVWKYTFPYPWKSTHKLRRIWLNGEEFSMSAGNSSTADNFDNLDGGATTYGTNSTHRFFSAVSNGILTLYVWTGGSNPASYYSRIEYSGVVQPDGTMEYFTVKLADADYIDIQGLDIRGGLYGSIGMKGSDYVTIEDCAFGMGSQYVGLMCSSGFISASDANSNYGIVRNCIIDSDFKEKYYLQYSLGPGIQFGIASTNGASYWKFYNNKIARWAIGYLDGNDNLTTSYSAYNEFFKNEIYYPEGTYAKGAQINGTTNYPNNYTKLYNNFFHDITMGINVCGANIYIGYNTLQNVRFANNEHATSGNSGYGISINQSGNTGQVDPDNVYIFNNLFNDLNGFALVSWSNRNTWYENNIMVNCRLAYTLKYYLQLSQYEKLRANNNLFFDQNSSTATKFVSRTDKTYYTVSEFNGIAETSLYETNKNQQHTSSLLALVDVNNFVLPPGSPAIDAGINRTWMPSTDFKGNNISGLRDIGSFEYSGSTVNSFAPTISSTAVTACLVGQSYSYDVNASGSPTPVYSLNTAPSGMTINSSTGLISWKPATAGSYSVTVQASNGVSPNDVQNFTIKVTEPAITNSAPVITSAPVNSAIAGQTYSYDVNATGSPAPTFSLSSAPGGMTINSTSGLIQWTPVSAGSYSVSVIAANGVLPNSVQTFTIQVIQQTESITPSGLISYWKMDETSGSTYKDEVGTLNASAVVLPTPVAGKVSGAQLFNGSTTRINVPVSKTYDFPTGSSFSISLWMKSTFVSSTSKPIIGRFSSADNFRWFLGTVNGKAYMYMSSAGRSAGLTGKTTVSNGSWNYLTVTRNSSGTVKLYINGVLEASTVFTGSFTSATAQLNIGWYSFQTNYYNGALDETAIFNKELSADEIQQYYNNSLSGKGYINNTQFITANAKVFLEGPYAAGVMNTNLKSGNVIPLAQPYNGSPWNYSGMERVTTVPVDVVDWILVEVRSGVSSSTVVNKRAAFLKKDGSIVDLDGSSDVKFSGVPAGNYYIVLTHRNHLEIMSAAPVSLSSSSLLYDFTLSASKSYGANSMINLGDGRYGMISGDGDSNGIINILDYGTVSRSINETGYLQGDLDMNKVVDIQDYEKSGSTLFYTSKVPQ